MEGEFAGSEVFEVGWLGSDGMGGRGRCSWGCASRTNAHRTIPIRRPRQLRLSWVDPWICRKVCKDRPLRYPMSTAAVSIIGYYTVREAVVQQVATRSCL